MQTANTLTLTCTFRTTLTVAENRANMNDIRESKVPGVTEWDALLTILAHATGQLDLVGQPAVTRLIIHAVDGDLVVVNRDGKITEVPAIFANLDHVE
jgi:hypothetical protein